MPIDHQEQDVVADAVAPFPGGLEQPLLLQNAQKALGALVGIRRRRITLHYAAWSALPRASEVPCVFVVRTLTLLAHLVKRKKSHRARNGCQRLTMSLPDERKVVTHDTKNEAAQHRDDTHTH